MPPGVLVAPADRNREGDMRRAQPIGWAAAAAGVVGMAGFLWTRAPAPAEPADGPAAGRPVAELIATLREPSPELRREATDALMRLGPAAAPALKPLLALLGDED